MFGIGSALAAAALAGVAANAQQIRSSDHHLSNESGPGPKNSALEAENSDSVWSPETDNGTRSLYLFERWFEANVGAGGRSRIFSFYSRMTNIFCRYQNRAVK